MTEALIEAQKAGQLGEVPIGAVIVRDGQIIGRGHNLTRTKNDPTCHAEMEAIRQAAAYLGGWRLIGCDMYVTAEPCAMCAGAIGWAQLPRVVYGAPDEKRGYTLLAPRAMHPKCTVTPGVLADECSRLMKDFFAARR